MNIRLPVSLKNEHYASISAFVFGLFVHFFGLVNITHNYDSISTPSGFGVGVTSGRWFLEFLGKVASKLLVGSYNLTWFNGIVFLLLIAVAVYFLISVLEIRSRLSSVVIGMAVVSFPTAASMLFFRYTSTYYAIAVVFAVLAVWVLKKWKYGLIPSALLTACGLGIYQAYMPITVAVFVLILLRQTLVGKEKISRLFLRGVYYCSSIVLGLVIYLVITKKSTEVLSVSLDTYQGLDQMGRMDIRELPVRVLSAFKTFFTSPRGEYKIVQNTLMEMTYAVLLGASLVMILYILFFRCRKLQWFMFTAFLCIAFPIAVNLIMIMSPDAYIYTLMLYSFALVLILPLVILDVLIIERQEHSAFAGVCKKFVFALLAVIIFCNTYFTNLNYHMQYYATCQTENYVNGLVTQVRMTEGFNPDKKWVFSGKIQDPLLENYWSELNQFLAYGINNTPAQLLRTYSWECWIYSYVGYTPPMAEEEEAEALRRSPQVQEMPCWPAEGSICVIGDYVVVKFDE